MKKAELYLNAAKIYGTVALLWSVPSLNIFGIIGAILSWKAYKSNNGDIARKAMFLYVAATVVSIIFGLVMLYFGIVVLGPAYEFAIAALISLVGDTLYIIAAVMSNKGNKGLVNQAQRQVVE